MEFFWRGGGVLSQKVWRSSKNGYLNQINRENIYNPSTKKKKCANFSKILTRNKLTQKSASHLRTSLISNVGICGRKSLPTKKHINTKSSTIRSKLISNGGLRISKSYCRYSRNTHRLRNCQHNEWFQI